MEKMPSMPSGRSHASSKLRRADGGGAGRLCAILAITAFVVFTLSVREGGNGFISTMSSVTQTIVSPFRMLGATITGPLTGLGNVARNLTADEKTLSDLMEENARLSARNVELEEAALTAQRLQELLDLKSTYNLQATAARVIAGSTDSWTATVTIDKGTNAGIAVGMPVVDQYGAVGQVISCAGTTSTVRLLSDEGSSVSAMVQSSRAQGMLEGSIDGTLHLKYIRTDQTVNVGDIVVTSGLGGVFPKGLPLGKVSSIEAAPGSTYYDIVIEPYSKQGSLEEVNVVTSLTDEQQATAEDIERADAKDLDAASGKSVLDEESTDSTASEQDDASDVPINGNAGTTETGTTSGDIGTNSSETGTTSSRTVSLGNGTSSTQAPVGAQGDEAYDNGGTPAMEYEPVREVSYDAS